MFCVTPGKCTVGTLFEHEPSQFTRIGDEKGKAALAYNLPCSDNLKPYFCSVKKFEFFKYW